MKPLRLIVPFAVFLLIAAACTRVCDDDEGAEAEERPVNGPAPEDTPGAATSS